MLSRFTLQSAAIMFTLVVLLPGYAPICRASTALPNKAATGDIKPNSYGKVHGPFLSEPEVRRVLKKAGFPAHAIPTMLQIARCESSLSVTAENVNRDGSVDFGLFQINERNWAGCHVSKTELSDPYNNTRCAQQVWQRQGFDAWGCCI